VQSNFNILWAQYFRRWMYFHHQEPWFLKFYFIILCVCVVVVWEVEYGN
jgi:hypothetical protein